MSKCLAPHRAGPNESAGAADHDFDLAHLTREPAGRLLIAGDVAARFLQAVLRAARVPRLLSHEHFSVDGTLIEA